MALQEGFQKEYGNAINVGENSHPMFFSLRKNRFNNHKTLDN